MLEMLMPSNPVIQWVGMFTVFCIGIAVLKVIEKVIERMWRNGRGNRRNDNDGQWPDRMLGQLESMNANLLDLNHALKDGLFKKIEDVYSVILKCHELNAIKDHELHSNRR